MVMDFFFKNNDNYEEQLKKRSKFDDIIKKLFITFEIQDNNRQQIDRICDKWWILCVRTTN